MIILAYYLEHAKLGTSVRKNINCIKYITI